MQLQVLPDNDTSVIRGPVIKKTGWPRGQWSGANPTPECFPFSGVPGANYADMEPHIGSEQGGKRPVVVLQNNIGNRHSPTLIVATVTTRTEKKKNQPTHVLVDSNPAFEEPSMILLEQIFTIDKSRIERFMGYAAKTEMLRIDMELLVSLALNVLSGNRSE